MSEVETIATVRKSVTVTCDIERAWQVFTAETSTWWPLATHSVHEEDAKEVVLEPREGGEMYELSESGERAHWARVLAWEPPRRLVLAWHVNPERPAPTEIEVTFHEKIGGTRVEVEHRGWERLGEEGRGLRDSYETGWPGVLECFRREAVAF